MRMGEGGGDGCGSELNVGRKRWVVIGEREMRWTGDTTGGAERGLRMGTADKLGRFRNTRSYAM